MISTSGELDIISRFRRATGAGSLSKTNCNTISKRCTVLLTDISNLPIYTSLTVGTLAVRSLSER